MKNPISLKDLKSKTVTTNNYFFGFGQVAKYYVDELIKEKNLIFLLQQHLTRQLRDLKSCRSFRININKYDKKISDYLKSSGTY